MARVIEGREEMVILLCDRAGAKYLRYSDYKLILGRENLLAPLMSRLLLPMITVVVPISL